MTQITLFNCTAERNRVNKHDYLSQIITMSGTLRSATSILNPDVVIELDVAKLEEAVNKRLFVIDDENNFATENGVIRISYSFINKVLSANYCYLNDFDRYYFIEDIVAIGNNLWAISMRTDVLMSHMGEIRQLSAFIDRSESDFNPKLFDSILPMKDERTVIDEIKNTGRYKNVTFVTNTDSILKKLNFVAITISSEQPNVYAYDVKAPFPKGNSICALAFSSLYSSNMKVMGWNEATELLGYIGLHSGSGDFLKSLIAYPFEPANNGLGEKIYLGTSQVDDVDGNAVLVANGKNLCDYLVLCDFDFDIALNMLQMPPYTIRELFIPFYGWIELPFNKCAGKHIILYYAVNYMDGSATAFVVTEQGDLIFSAPCQLGVHCSITTTNAQDLANTRNASNLNMILSLVGAGLTTVGGVASGNPVAVGAGILSAVKAVGTHVTTNATLFDHAQSSASDSLSSMMGKTEAVLRTTISAKTDVDFADFAKLYGRPLQETRILKNLTGYCKVARVHVENIKATSTELEEIETSLLNGVIL